MLYTAVQLSPLLVLASLGELALFSPAIEEFLSCGRELGMSEEKQPLRHDATDRRGFV